MAYFLNALYTMFDSVTDKYNIFKDVSSNFDSNQPTYDIVLFTLQVDKVNDTHMIASGVPEKNGDKHAPGPFHLEKLYLGFLEIAFPSSFTLRSCIILVFQRLLRWLVSCILYLVSCILYLVSWFLIEIAFTSLYLGFSEIATMALDLLNTSSGLRTPDRNRPTDRIQVQFSLIRSSSSLSESWNYFIFSSEPASIQAP